MLCLCSKRLTALGSVLNLTSSPGASEGVAAAPMTPGQMMLFGRRVAATKAKEAESKAEMRALPIAEMEVPVRS